MRTISRRELMTIAATGAVAFAAPARADAPAPFSPDEIVNDGQRFFGTVSRGLADGVQEAGRRWGLPNAYILGQEASGAFVGGLTIWRRQNVYAQRRQPADLLARTVDWL